MAGWTLALSLLTPVIGDSWTPYFVWLACSGLSVGFALGHWSAALVAPGAYWVVVGVVAWLRGDAASPWWELLPWTILRSDAAPAVALTLGPLAVLGALGWLARLAWDGIRRAE